MEFEPFWREFQQAVRNQDQSALYRLTSHSQFAWLKDDLPLERVNPGGGYYRFGSEDDFRRVYATIFAPRYREKLLSKQPVVLSGASREISWKDRSFTYMLSFDVEGGQYKYIGLSIGPP